MAQKKLWDYATPNNDYIRAPITKLLSQRRTMKSSLTI
jgi:hypothetical protein